MATGVYQVLGETMSRRGLGGRSADVPEYQTMLRVLFTPEEAEIQNAMPAERFTPGDIAAKTGKNIADVTRILEAMADKGTCMSYTRGGTRLYFGPPLMPGIFEFQFMRGTSTDRDREIACAINGYRKAAASSSTPARTVYPGSRVIPVGRNVQAQAAVQTYDQVIEYINTSDPIAITTCYCRHEAILIDEKDNCGMPMEVCMQFRTSAEYIIERKIGRRIDKQEAMDIMRRAEDAGLVHACVNTQRLDFICNCCACHCAILQGVLRQPKPGEAMLHGFVPSVEAERCTLCGVCVDRCPTDALTINGGDAPTRDDERCIGCGACASGCAENAIVLVARDGQLAPPADRRALGQAIMKLTMGGGAF